jgi:hypothetical protein
MADMIGRLLLAPPSPALWEEAAILVDLAAVTDNRPEALAIAYEYVFGRNVYPYESLYCDEELMLNTATAEQLPLRTIPVGSCQRKTWVRPIISAWSSSFWRG